MLAAVDKLSNSVLIARPKLRGYYQFFCFGVCRDSLNLGLGWFAGKQRPSEVGHEGLLPRLVGKEVLIIFITLMFTLDEILETSLERYQFLSRNHPTNPTIHCHSTSSHSDLSTTRLDHMHVILSFYNIVPMNLCCHLTKQPQIHREPYPSSVRS